MRKLSYLLIAGSLLLLASCKKYLNTVPNDVLTVDDIFTSRANVDGYLANIYSSLPNELRQRFTANENSGFWEGASDEAKYNWDFVYTNKMVLSTWSNTDNDVDALWKNFYQAIRNATDFMNRIGTANPTEVPATLKVQYKAEARGLRALFYFYLLRMYGPVVLLGDNLISPDASTSSVRLARSPFDSCVNFITTQLDSAYLDLPVPPKLQGTPTLAGQLNKGVMKAYKVEALLLAASPLYNGNTEYASFKNADGTQLISQTYDAGKWQKAAAAAKDFLTEFVPGSYQLYNKPDPNNPGVFQDAYYSCKQVMLDEWNNEWIFARSHSDSYVRYDKTPKHVGSPSAQSGAGALGVTQGMVDAFAMANGKAITDPSSGYVSSGWSQFQSPSDPVAHSTYNQWVGREPRFYVDVTYDSLYWLTQVPGYDPIITAYQYSGNSGRSQSTSDVSPTGYSVRKDVAGSDDARGALLLRLSNIYLDYAEALNESDQGNADILTYLNAIRQRAGVPQYGTDPVNNLPLPVGQDAMRAAIRNERRIELAFENVRYFDTRRWKIAPVTDAGPVYGMNMYVDGPAFYQKTLIETRIFLHRDYFFPIPNNEVLIDNKMVQNPGW